MDHREPIELPVEHIPNSSEPPFVRTFEVRFGTPFDESPPMPRPTRRRIFLPLLLFLATCVSTFAVGSEMFGARVVVETPVTIDGRIVIRRELTTDWTAPETPLAGMRYSIALMSILLAHEMGHFLQARRYGVPASWPWFIPVPATPMGTMGAVIVHPSARGDAPPTNPTRRRAKDKMRIALGSRLPAGGAYGQCRG